MLVLTRRIGEKITIDGPATITVLGRNGKAVRLGIEAPQGTKVLRGELAKRNQQNDRDREAA